MHVSIHRDTDDIPVESCGSVCKGMSWAGIGQDIIIVLAGTITVLIVYFGRKRTEFFFVLTPLLFSISCAIGLLHAYVQPPHSIKQENGLTVAFDVTSQSFDLLAHWIFSAQYLRTSLVLPKLFTEASLEWVH